MNKQPYYIYKQNLKEMTLELIGYTLGETAMKTMTKMLREAVTAENLDVNILVSTVPLNKPQSQLTQPAKGIEINHE